MIRTTTLLLMLCSTSAFAQWRLDNNTSTLHFTTLKAADAVEVHRFTELSGQVDEDGTASVVIALASVDTAIPIRDERMREMLFNTAVFPTATATTRLDLNSLATLPSGGTSRLTTEVMLSISGAQLPLTADLLVVRLNENTMLVATLQPLIVNAASVNLAKGVIALQEIAGLPSISNAVTASFMLTFRFQP